MGKKDEVMLVGFLNKLVLPGLTLVSKLSSSLLNPSLGSENSLMYFVLILISNENGFSDIL